MHFILLFDKIYIGYFINWNISLLHLDLMCTSSASEKRLN